MGAFTSRIDRDVIDIVPHLYFKVASRDQALHTARQLLRRNEFGMNLKVERAVIGLHDSGMHANGYELMLLQVLGGESLRDTYGKARRHVRCSTIARQEQRDDRWQHSFFYPEE